MTEKESSKHGITVDNEIIEWLSKNFEQGGESPVNKRIIIERLSNQIAVSYLILWPLMESRNFNGFMHYEDIKNASSQLSDYYDDELSEDLDEIVERFYNRYKNKEKGKVNEYFKGLGGNTKERREIETILEIDHFSNMSPVSKLQLLFFVIYRYRNNIFHGNKAIGRWDQYNVQIRDCLKAMMVLMDCMNDHPLTRPSNNKMSKKEFWEKIYSNATSDEERLLEILKLRGFLFEDNDSFFSDNSFLKENVTTQHPPYF